MLGTLASASGVALTATSGWLIARAAEQPPVLLLMVAIVAVRTFGIARPVLRYAERLVSHDAALTLLADRRATVFDSLVPLTPGRLGRHRGDLLASVVDDVDALLDRYLRVRMPVVTAVAVVLLAAGFAGWQAPAAGLVVLLAGGLGGASAWTAARTAVRRTERSFVAGRAALSDLVLQTLHGAESLRLWQADRRRLDEVDAAGSATSDAAVRSTRGAALGRAAVVASSGLGVLGVALVGAHTSAGAVSGPMLALLLLLPLALAEVTAPLADAGALSVRTAAADERLAALAATPAAVAPPVAPVPADLSRPGIVADKVTAGWGGAPAFRGLDLEIRPGTRLGVVGPSGCGKSTLAAVLLRFLDPASGEVSLGDVALDQLALDDVRGTVGLVDDDPHVFGSTLRENLRLARPEADDGEILAALDAAALGPWVASLPDGLDTRLGDGAAHVSGGERARLGLARSWLADQPVLVLDEPTAHLDAATAADVARDLLAGDPARPTRSIVWITHGTVGLDLMDRVVSLAPAPLGVPT